MGCAGPDERAAGVVEAGVHGQELGAPQVDEELVAHRQDIIRLPEPLWQGHAE